MKYGRKLSDCTACRIFFILTSFKNREKIMGKGNTTTIDKIASTTVFFISFSIYGSWNIFINCFKPTHSLPRIPLNALKS